MAIEDTFGNLFKPEVRTSGRKLFAQEKVSLSSQSDTGIHAYVRGTPSFKVTFSADSVASRSFTTDCSCPVAKKSRFCKHVWATLLAVEESHPDFLSNKNDLNQVEVSADAEPSKQSTYQEASKQRANEYRKDQYQKAKVRAKDRKRERSDPGSVPESKYPGEIESALQYFAQNGFEMPEGPSREILSEAKKKLSRFFHPDKGGTHDEVVELNRNCDLIMDYLK